MKRIPHYVIMTVSMILAGLMSPMNTWATNLGDVYFSLNDIYMIGIMTGCMFFFMGLFMRQWKEALVGGIVGSLFLMAVRFQWWVGQTQYLRQMIPHHSMFPTSPIVSNRTWTILSVSNPQKSDT